MPTSTEIRRKILTKVRADVRGRGLSIVAVADEAIGFAYTVGRYTVGRGNTVKLPELLIFGLRPETAHNMLTELDKLMPVAVLSGMTVSLGGDFPVMLLDAGEAAKTYTKVATAFYDSTLYRVQQVLLCDPTGRFPPDCAAPFNTQPILAVQ
jgi:hypothetical protein